MSDYYNNIIDDSTKLKEKDLRRLTEYLNLLTSCTTKEEAQQIESFYFDLSDFRFIKRFVPDIDNSTMFDEYLKTIKQLRDSHISMFKHIYNYEPIQIDIKSFANTNNVNYSIENFLKDAINCKTNEEYKEFYKKNYNFEKATLFYTSPATISIFSSRSELPIINVENSYKNKAKLYSETSDKGYDLGFIPTPEEVTNNGLHLLLEKLQDFSNKVDINFNKKEEENIESSIYEKYQQFLEDSIPDEDVEEYQENLEEQYNEQQSLQEKSSSNIATIKEFQQKLVAECIVKPDETFIILNELEAKAKGLSIKTSAEKDFITLNIPVVDTNGNTNFVPTKYYHTSALDSALEISNTKSNSFDSLSLKHKLFVSNPYKEGTPVPPIGIMNHYTGNINILSGYSFSKSEDMGHTIVLSSPDNEVKISSHIYKEAIKNSLLITDNTTITNDIYEHYLEVANLDQDRQRINTASNFWHNYKAYCRVHCNNPQEALEAAKHIISEMSSEEKCKLKNNILNYQKISKESYTDRLVSFYNNSVSDKKIKDFSPFNENALQSIKYYADINNKKGSKISNKCNIKIGDTIKLRIDVKDIFKKNSFIKLPPQELILISSCAENNKVVLSDKNGLSKFVMKLDDFTDKVQKYEKEKKRKEKYSSEVESISYS